MTPQNRSNLSIKTITNFCKQKGLVFQSSEIYGGYSAIYDFGPLGTLLKKNIENAWRNHMITYRDDVVEIEGAIFMHPKVWEASGHIAGFADLLVEDTVTNSRYRADHLIEESSIYMPGDETKTIITNAGHLTTDEIDTLIEHFNLKSPDGNKLSKTKKFNLLVKTHLGPIEDASTVAYLKGESCQNIYVDWLYVQDTTRRKLPFGIAQAGKAFRNEITARQFLFRTRELEQLDVQFFIKPDKFLKEGELDSNGQYQYWKDYTYEFYNKTLGLDQSRLSWRQHDEDEKAFYARDAWDIQYTYGSMGAKEVGGLHNRGSYDLDQHSKFSGQELGYFDQDVATRYNPEIIETSLGFGRMFLAVIFEHYDEEVLEDGTIRTVLRLPRHLSPYKFAVLPLMKKDGLAQKAKELQMSLKKQGISTDYDEAGSIGKRYRRQDESGTYYAICVDYQTLEDGTVTVRNRDTMIQERVSIDDLSKLA